MKYSDFVLRFTPVGEGLFRVHLQTSPAGEIAGTLRMPVSSQQRFILPGIPNVREAEVKEHSPPTEPPQVLGDRLFQALFAGSIGKLYERSRGTLQEDANHGLRIKLHLGDAESEQIHHLPWEMLFNAEGNEFLGLSSRLSIVRSLDVARPLVDRPQPTPLKILVATAGPPQLSTLDAEKEQDEIFRALEKLPGVEPEVLQHTSLHSLREALHRHPFHVLHFIGHGRVARSFGSLILEEDGQAVPVSGAALSNVLSDFHDLRIVVLNACHSGRSGSTDPMTGVASALLSAGLSSVVAMQLPISDRAAINFSRAFYRRLAAGGTLDAAVVEGRHAIHAANPESAEWVAPVLFQRVPDGRVWRLAEDQDFSSERKESRQSQRSNAVKKWPAILLAILACIVWPLVRLGTPEPEKVTTLILSDESAAIEELKGINSNPISLAAVVKLLDIVTQHNPPVIGLDIALSQAADPDSGATALAESLHESNSIFVLAKEEKIANLAPLVEVCNTLGAKENGQRCEEASIRVTEPFLTLGGQTSDGERPFFLALSQQEIPFFVGEVILPLNASWSLEKVIVPVHAEHLIVAGIGGKALNENPVIIGGLFEENRSAREVDRHYLFGPWGTQLSGAHLQAVLAGHSLSNDLLWMVDLRYLLLVLGPIAFLAWRYPLIRRLLPLSYLAITLILRIFWPLVLPLWPFWAALLLNLLHRGRS